MHNDKHNMEPLSIGEWNQPGMDSSLSKVPPVNPSPLPETIGTFNPHAAKAGARTYNCDRHDIFENMNLKKKKIIKNINIIKIEH